MSPVDPLFAIFSTSVALLFAFLLIRSSKPQIKTGRYATIDGLRGYLAFFVFLHHSCIWYFYLRSGRWELPPSNIYTNFGQSSVSLFFMITGFLFYGKILDSKKAGIGWVRLYTSRVMRIYPLYLFVLFILFLLVGIRSHWQVRENIYELAKHFIEWFGLTIPGAPNINSVQDTWIMVAGVTWTLCYEAFFYAILPILALTKKIVSVVPVLIISILWSIMQIHYWHPRPLIMCVFLGGVFAAFSVRNQHITRLLSTSYSSVLLLLLLIFQFVFFHGSYNIVSIIILSFVFCQIASGNSLFGVFLNPVSRLLGEISYGIYLLQGVVLFTYWKYVIGFHEAATASPLFYWVLQAFSVPLLILFSFFTYNFIEKPALSLVPIISEHLKNKFLYFTFPKPVAIRGNRE